MIGTSSLLWHIHNIHVTEVRYIDVHLLFDFIFSGVVGRPPFPPATTSMSSFTASGGMPEYYQSQGGHFGTNQTESMQVAENSSEVHVMGNIKQKNIFSREMSKITIFFLHIKLSYLNVIYLISNFTCIKKLHLISERERERSIFLLKIFYSLIIHGTLYLTGIAVFR